MHAKRFPTLLMAGMSLISTVLGASQQAPARLYCISLQFQRGIDSTTQYSLDLENGELWYYNSSSHAANVTLNDQWFDDRVGGYIMLPIPNLGDANNNGYPDFFESVRPVNSTVTSGSYGFNVFGSGTLECTWARAAGSSLGSCVFRFKPESFYTWLTFNMSFKLQEYSGPLTYTPGLNSVTGRVDLVQTDAPESLLGGPVNFVKTTSDPFNSLMLQPGTWTNSWQQTMAYSDDLFERDVRWPSNYYGYVVFDDDANSATPYPFEWWVLSIDDANDANHNGIPDFSDAPASALPRRPQLTLTRGEANLWLTIAGDVGHLHEVQQAASLPATNWSIVWSQSLTNDPQTISLPASSGSGNFWRVIAR